jgi:hypothetical protein
VLGALIPNLTAFYMLDAMMLDKAVPASYFMTALGYCVLYSGAVLALGIAMFQTRPLETQGGSGSMPALVGLLAWSGRAGAIACGIFAAVFGSLSSYHTFDGLALTGALALAAIIGWVLWGYFGRGAKWAYWLVLAGDIAALGALISSLMGLWDLATVGVSGDPQVRAAVATSFLVCVFCVLILPRTRRHFSSESLE